MKIGMLGAGRMGQALAPLFLQAGHEVKLTNSRGPDSLAELVEVLGPGASAGNPGDLPGFSDVILLATLWHQVPAASRALGHTAGAIVIDTTNNRRGPRPEHIIDLQGRSSSEVVADMLPGVRIVKAFNHAAIAAMAQSLGHCVTEPKGLFIAGDDPEAKRLVGQLIRSIGGEPIDTGSLIKGGRLFNAGGPLGRDGLLSASKARDLLKAVTQPDPGQ